MSAHSGFGPSDDGVIAIQWTAEPRMDRSLPPAEFSPWEVRMIEQGWRVIEACMVVDAEALPPAIRAMVAEYEQLEEVWYGEMRQSPVWPSRQGRGQAARAEQVQVLLPGMSHGDDRGQD